VTAIREDLKVEHPPNTADPSKPRGMKPPPPKEDEEAAKKKGG